MHATRQPDPRSLLLLVAGAAVLIAASGLMLAGIEPVYTWYYSFAWYSTIAIADAWGHRRDPSLPLLLRSPRILISLIGWSAVIWLFFELWNLRLANWYYVSVPRSLLARRLGVFLAFGTVLPGIFSIERLLGTYGVAARWRSRPFTLPAWAPAGLAAIGLGWAVLVLAWPRVCYPLVWGVAVLVLTPLNRRLSGAGLLAELEAGRWGRIVRLLLAGLACGFLWEMFNIRAGGKWVYTVPGFEAAKLFEMPVLGFLGFPPFALECYVMYRSLVLAGAAVPWEGGAAPRRGGGRRAAAALCLAAGAAILLVTPPLVDRYTVDSLADSTADLVALGAAAELRAPLVARLDALGVRQAADLERLLEAPDSAARLGIDAPALGVLRERVELALLRGVGADNVRRLRRAGIGNVAQLAAAEPERLAAELAAAAEVAAASSRRVTPARVRVWVRAARRVVEQRSATE